MLSKNRKYFSVALVVTLVLAIVFACDFFLYPHLVKKDSIQSVNLANKFNKGKNGLWLRYLWYAGKYTPTEENDLAKLLQTEQIRYAYFHVREVDKSGHLLLRSRTASKRLLDTLHKQAPNVMAIAWVSAGPWYPANGTDIAKPEVRSQMIKEASYLINDCGFDGIQWDYEPCSNNDPSFISLLKETKKAFKDKFISVASPMWYPPKLRLWYPQWINYGWSEDYFHQVAMTCDQIALMCYDSGSIYPRAYEWLVTQQPVHLEKALGGTNCTYMLGLSTYDRNFFHDYCETEALGIKAAKQGLSVLSSDGAQRKSMQIVDTKCDGIALFADYTTDAKEWRLYNSMWRD